MGIPTLISTSTASNASSVSITSGIDSTYDEYMFVFTDIGPATDNVHFTFNGSIDGGSNYNVTKTTTYFRAFHNEDDSAASLSYDADHDLAQGTGFQTIAANLGNGGDESCAGELFLFNPSNTTYVKHFYSKAASYLHSDIMQSPFAAGYFNNTNDIDAVQFKMSSGNFDGVIQLFGIS
jgi:hypothetical protein